MVGAAFAGGASAAALSLPIARRQPVRPRHVRLTLGGIATGVGAVGYVGFHLELGLAAPLRLVLGAVLTLVGEIGIFAYRRSRPPDCIRSSGVRSHIGRVRETGRRRDRCPGASAPGRPAERITMLLENNAYPQDVRVRHEAESLVAAGHGVEVVAPRHPRQSRRERVNGVDVRRFRTIHTTRASVPALIIEYAAAMVALHVAAVRALFKGTTVLHIHNPPDMLFIAGAMFKLAGRGVVFDHHDLGPELVAVRLRSRILVWLARAGERLTFAVASHVLAANESHGEIAITRGRKGSHDVTVVRNGPPASWLHAPVLYRPGRLSSVRLAYLGTLAAQDGVDGLAPVLAYLRDRNPPIEATLTIVGDGDGRRAVEAELKRWGVDGSVTFMGWVAIEEVPRLLRGADICVEPAPASELNMRSTMIKLAEYLALGKPVVAYDLLETRRTVREAAALVPPEDAHAFAEEIAGLASDPFARMTLARRARERARALTWDRSERALLAAYSSLSAGYQHKVASARSRVSPEREPVALR